MKRIFTLALAVAALAACNKSEVVETAPAAAIAFDNAFVDNATKAATDITKTNLIDFGVYGTVAKGGKNALIFDNTEVSKVGGAYTYSPAQYWVEGAEYTFSAYAPFENAKWSFAETDAYNGTLSFDNASANGEQDLLFASAARTTGTISAAPEAVSFTFSHLLSKVVFKYTNVFTDNNISLNVYDVKINNAAAKGEIPVTDGVVGDWTGTEDYVRSFGDATADADKALANAASTTTEHFYLIPVEREYNITFKVDLYQAGVLLDTYEHEVKTTINLEKGKSYSFNANLAPQNVNPETQLYPIEFNVNAVEEWVNVNTELEATPVATAAELAAAVAKGGSVKLTENLTLTGTELQVAAGIEVNVNLNGKTLTVNALDPIKNNGMMTIEGGKIEAANSENTRRCIYNYGEMTINGVEFTQTYDKKGAAINNEGKLTIEDATVNAVFFSIWTSGANSETIINGGTFTTENNVDLRDTWAYAVIAKAGAKTIINGGNFTGNHGVIAADTCSEVIINGGTFHCTATYTGNSDWALYAEEDSSIKYDADKCTITSANPNGAIYGNVTAF